MTNDKDQIPVSPYRFTWFDWFCLWYPPGWLILFNRHWQHYKANPNGWNWLEYGLFLIPGGFYLASVIRRLRLGSRGVPPIPLELPPAAQTEPDPAYQRAFQQEILTPIVHRYFRGTLTQLENLPAKGPLIVAMNHTGMCFPWDFVGLGLLLSQQRDWFVQPLAHPIFFDHPWLVGWLPPGWAEVLGGVRAEQQSFEAAISEKNILLYAPEGWRGLAKGWQQRYQLAKFDPSFIRLSLRHQVPIMPVVCMGSEYLHPFTFNVQRLARWFKLPMFPISPLILPFLLFPSMGVWAMRTRLRYHILPIWSPWEESEDRGRGEGEKAENAHAGSQNQGGGGMSGYRVTYQMAKGLRSQLQDTINYLRKSPD
ncbi:MAG: 1-acyl-sn-glycerol-3-phosphate acyltransferase [Kovacikia sp.]